ncbi:MAG: hypothetical protein JW955_21300 [Sedimentisphaerales bacterium]|nr:hypothetical protein [Sedimentisphaerales bacterium]
MTKRMLLAATCSLVLAASAHAGHWVVQGKTRIVDLERMTSSRGALTTFTGTVEYKVYWSDKPAKQQWLPMPKGKTVEVRLLGWGLKEREKSLGTTTTNGKGEVSLTGRIPPQAEPGWGQYQIKFVADQQVAGSPVQASHKEQRMEIK